VTCTWQSHFLETSTRYPHMLSDCELAVETYSQMGPADVTGACRLPQLLMAGISIGRLWQARLSQERLRSALKCRMWDTFFPLQFIAKKLRLPFLRMSASGITNAQVYIKLNLSHMFSL